MPARLPIPDSKESLLYLAVVQRLKSDPTLSRVVKTWVVYDGSFGETTEPATANMPMVVIDVDSDPANIETEQSTTTPVTFSVVAYTSGTAKTDSLNLWNAVRSCLFPGDGTVQALIQKYGGYRIRLARAGVGHTQANGTWVLTLRGTVTVELLVKTAM